MYPLSVCAIGIDSVGAGAVLPLLSVELFVVVSDADADGVGDSTVLLLLADEPLDVLPETFVPTDEAVPNDVFTFDTAEALEAEAALSGSALFFTSASD